MRPRHQSLLQCLSIVTKPGRSIRSLSVVALTAGIAVVGVPQTTLATVLTTQTFTTTGVESTYVVPAGVTMVNVTANGGQGSDNGDANSFGGYGSAVGATIPVTPNETLYIDVGSVGGVPAGGASGPKPSGGNGGTRETDKGGGGGGASLVSTCSITSSACTSNFYTVSEPRLIVAGGGGGGGGYGGCSGGNGAAGVGHGQGPGTSSGANCTGGGGGGNGTGSAGVATGDDTGGAGGSPSAAGAGGMDTAACNTTEPVGSAGSGPVGGGGFDNTGQAKGLGGGGGGGYYGGGGGATDLLSCDFEWGAGGGAGSSYVTPGATNATYGNDTTLTSEVVISIVGRLGGYVPGGNPGTSSTHWVGTTTYSGFTCATVAPSYTGAVYETNTTTAIRPGDIVVPGASTELDTPTEEILQCSFQTAEHPRTNQFTSGTTGCLSRTSVTSSFWYQTENIAGLITLRCWFYPSTPCTVTTMETKSISAGTSLTAAARRAPEATVC